MSYETMCLNNKIKWAEHQIKIATNSIDFWTKALDDTRAKYSSHDEIGYRHIHRVKDHLKRAKDNLKYWQNELHKLNIEVVLVWTS